MGWKSYRDLVAWQKAMDLVDEIYRLAKLLPSEEKYALADQMRRAAVSVPANIAEGHGRRTKNDFKHFLTMANGSVFETETLVYIGIRQAYYTQQEATLALDLCAEVGKILAKLILTISSEN